jgi:hypothetical protein
MRAPRWLWKERQRLRRKFIKKVSTRSYHTVDRWLDFEFIKAGSPLWMAMFISVVMDLPPANPWIFTALAVSVPWWLFIAATLLQVYGRWGDRIYMSITRRKLSKEYRR